MAALSEEITKLSDPQCNRLEIYQLIFKKLFESEGHDLKDVNLLCHLIQDDVKNGSNELQEYCLNNLLTLCQTDSLRQLISEESKDVIMRSVITLIGESKEDKVLNACFSFLSITLSTMKLNQLATELLENIADNITKKSISVTTYTSMCNFMQRFFKEYEEQFQSFMHILPKLIFLPLTHDSVYVREAAEITLNAFPKSVLHSENESFCNNLLKIIKDQYCKDLLELFKDKQELYVLKIWKHVVSALGKTLHSNLMSMTPFFQIIEKGFKSTSDDVCKMSFMVWKCLISNFALDEAVLNDSKKLRFILKPFKNISRTHESTFLAVCDTWWHLAWSLSHNLSSRFTEVCIPMLEFTVGKSLTGPHEKSAIKMSQNVLVRRGCHLLLRYLEQPDNTALNRICSPKKLPSNFYTALQVPLESKVLVRHFKEICAMIKIILELLGNTKDMANHIECLMKSALFIISTVVEDRSKESVEAVTSFLSLITAVIESRMCSSLLCLKCIDSLSKLSRSTLISHCYNGGSRKPQDILCTTLLKLLLNSYLLTKDHPKRFLGAYNRLIQAGLCESLNPLLMAQKFTHFLKISLTPVTMDAEIIFDMWSGLASPLLEIIEKTQEVNQGDKREHDFSCLYDVLLCPFEHIFPVTMHQLRTKPSLQLWTNLYKAFIRCASLVPTTVTNEACELFCSRLKDTINEELLKEPHYFETVCFLLQVVNECVDANFVRPDVSSQVLSSPSFMARRKKPLGNLTSIIDILSLLVKVFHDHYFNSDEDIYQSCTPKAQRKSHISKTAVPIDLVKSVFTSVISGSLIPFALEQLAEPISKVFFVNQKKSSTSVIGAKLEILWNVLTSSIENHYVGPYDSDFLTTMSPLLESTFSHPRRQIKDRSKRFWFATFAPVSSGLKYPESLKNSLKKAKVTLAPDESISTLEDFSCTMGSGSLEESGINFHTMTLKNSFAVPTEVNITKKTEKKIDTSELKSTPKVQSVESKINEGKSTSKTNIDELPSSEFVEIDVSTPTVTTPKRRSVRKRKSFVPALYNDLTMSQDTNTLGGSSESFDTASSSEIMVFKSQSEEICKATVEEEKNTSKVDEENSTNKNLNSVHFRGKVLFSDNAEEKNVAQVLEVLTAKVESNTKNHILPMKEDETSLDSDSISIKLNQSCMVINLSDSDEIIPSSQSSVENDSFRRFPYLENTSKCSTGINKLNETKECNTEISSENKVSTDSVPMFSPLENDENNFTFECPETPMHLMETVPKVTDSEIAVHECSLVEDSMPLKSSENIQNSDEQNVKLGNVNNKTVLNDIVTWMDNTDEKLKVSENVSILNNNVIVIQNNVDVHQKPDSKEELQLYEKINSKSDITLPVSNKNDTDDLCNGLPTKNLKKSLRRKTLDPTSLKKTAKRTSARASLPGPAKLKKSKQNSMVEDCIPEIIEVDLESKVENTAQASLPGAAKLKKSKQNTTAEDCIPEINEVDLESNVKKSIDSQMNSSEIISDVKILTNIPKVDIELVSTVSELKSTLDLQIEVSDKISKTSDSNEYLTSTENKIKTRSCQPSETHEKSLKRTYEKSLVTDLLESSSPIEKIPPISDKNAETDFDMPKSKHAKSSACNSNVFYSSLDVTVISNTPETESKPVNFPFDNKERNKTFSRLQTRIEDATATSEAVQNNNAKKLKKNTKRLCRNKNSKLTKLEKNSSVRDKMSKTIQASTCDIKTKTFMDIKENESEKIEKIVEPIIDQALPESIEIMEVLPCRENKSIVSSQIQTNKFVNAAALKEIHSEVPNFCSSSRNGEFIKYKESSNTEDCQNSIHLKSSTIEETCETIELTDSPFLPKILAVYTESADILMTDSNSEIAETPLEMLHNSSGDIIITQPDNTLTLENTTQDKEVSVGRSSEQDSVNLNECPIPINADIFKNSGNNEIVSSKISAEDDLQFSEDEDLENIQPNVFEITEVVNAVLKESILKISDNQVPNLNNNDFSLATSSEKSDEINPMQQSDEVNSMQQSAKETHFLDQVDVNSPERDTDTQGISDTLDNKFDTLSDSDSDDKTTDPIAESWLGGLALSSELTCFAVPSKKRDSLKLIHAKKLFTDEERSSSRKRKGKCPKRSILNQKTSKLSASKNELNPENCVPSSPKLISKLGKRSLQEDTVPIIKNDKFDKKLSTLSVRSLEMSESSPNGKKPKRALLSSQILGKTGLEANKSDTWMILKNERELKNDEITDMNTRFNANSGTETRRLKMMASSQQSLKIQKQDSSVPNVVFEQNGCEQDNNKPSSSILKKRKAADDSISVKLRKVTFADPLVEEKIFRRDDSICTKIPVPISEKGVEIVIKNISSETDKAPSISVVLSPSSNEPISSSYEYQNSDNLTTYNTYPVSPSLINCEDSISCILKDLTSPAWIRALETLLLSKDIKTVGDLCKLNIHELKDLPFKSPKLQTLHNALLSHITRTQKAIEEKCSSSDENCYTVISNFESSAEPSTSNIDNVTTEEFNKSECLEEIAKELLKEDNLKSLQKSTLIALAKKCFSEVTAKLEDA